ncbi:MAG TPA: hypothetical protein VHQ65_14950, partial [Thermoanaerobaculia bacterium]|nr:hypothetical protein [Thermoanaerobaculia bacterium]
ADAALASGAAALLVLPHFLLRRAVFGDPFHDENWKNLAWKLHGHPDWSYLERVPFAGPGELLREDLGAILAGGFAELGRFLAGGLSQLLGTPLHALAFAFSAVALLGWRPRAAGWLLASGALMLVGVAFTFFTWGRLLLVLLPIANAVTFGALAAEDWPAAAKVAAAGTSRRSPSPPALAATLLLAAPLLGLLAVKTALGRLPAFVERHPYEEVAVLRQVAERVPPGTVIAGTAPFLGRYVERPYVPVPDAFGAELDEPERYYARLERLLADRGAAYLVVSRDELRDRPQGLLAERPPAPFLEPAGGGDGVRLWRVDPRAPRTQGLPPAPGRLASAQRPSLARSEHSR